jgi:hypothetical protein
MKRTFGTLAFLAASVVGLNSFGIFQGSSVTGKVTPPDQVEYVWAISGTDSLKTTAENGSFALTLKAGSYKVVVDAKDPYKDAVLDSVQVKDGQVTDLGEIKLQQ